MPKPFFLVCLLAAAIVALLLILRRTYFLHVTVHDFQRGLRFKRGKLESVLESGRYLTFRPWETITVVDMRSAIAAMPNQEILTADNLCLRISTSVSFRVSDAARAVLSSQSYLQSLYLCMQLIVRELVSAVKVDELLAKRNELSEQFMEELKRQAEPLGLAVENGGIKDITFPADLKKAFNQVIQAEKSAQATLTKSRSETACLRTLANAARMMEDNPNLLSLRTLQSVSELSAASGNTIVFGLPPAMMPQPFPPRPGGPPPRQPDTSGEDD